MNIKMFEGIFEEDDVSFSERENGDDVLKGLKILEKYFPNKMLLEGASHDIVYSKYVEQIVDAGITEDDARELLRLGWHIENGTYLAHFV